MTRTAFERALAAHGVKVNVVMEVSREAVREAVENLGSARKCLVLAYYQSLANQAK